MPTPYIRLDTPGLNALLPATVGSLKPYQLRQIMDYLNRIGNSSYFSAGASEADVSGQPTLSTIAASMGPISP